MLCCGYHGWHDWYIGTTERQAGVPGAVRELTATFGYNDLESVVAAIDDQTACVILEPVTFDAPKDGFLHELRRLCDRHGTLLIFDEMWTGFRLDLGGAQAHFDVRADLACFSKAVANGLPLSVLSGRRDVMRLLDQDVFFFSTFGGEALSLAAALATLDVLERERVPERLARQGARLQVGFNALAAELDAAFVRCVGYPGRTLIVSDAAAAPPLLVKSFLQQELIRHGILWGGFHNLSLSHGDEDVAYTLAAYARILPQLREAVAQGDLRARLRGEPVAPVFRRSSGFHTRPRKPQAAAR